MDFEAVTDEELKELFKGKKGSRFDNAYNAVTYAEFYQPADRFSEIFYTMAYKLSTLHRYLEYSRRFLEEYLEVGETFGRELIADKGRMAEEKLLYCETFYADQRYLTAYNYESIFLMLYTVYETFLRTLTFEVGEMTHKKFNERDYKGAFVYRYLEFLEAKGKMRIDFKHETRTQFDAIRKIRNVFIHSAGIPENETLLQSIQLQFPALQKESRIELNYEFLITAFEVIGTIIYALEQAYWDISAED